MKTVSSQNLTIINHNGIITVLQMMICHLLQMMKKFMRNMMKYGM